MLVEFSVTNFRSFKGKQTFSLEAGVTNPPEEDKSEYIATGFKKFPYLLRCGAIYGANGSGKSNLFKAFLFFRKFVYMSFEKNRPGEEIETDPFCLSSATLEAPTEFEIYFIVGEKLYFYAIGFNKKRILTEKLTFIDKSKTRQTETTILDRKYDPKTEKYEYSPKNIGKIWNEFVRENTLSLVTAAYHNHEIAQKLYEWFGDKLHCMGNRLPLFYTRELYKKQHLQEKIKSIVAQADIGILDFQEVKIENNIIENMEFPEDLPGRLNRMILEDRKKTFEFTMKSADEKHNKIMFEEQSDGTKILSSLAGPIAEVLDKGEVLFIDEIDRSLHPHLVEAILKLFLSPKTNPNNAQIIFTAHDTYFMQQLKREEIWFTEKNEEGATELFSLLEMKERDGVDFEKRYHLGKYGAVPNIFTLS